MDNFNVDITLEILSHLPMKILLKFRSVSKSWRDIIDSSTLINLHVENQLSNTVVSIDDDTVFLQLMPRPDEHLNGKLLKTIMVPDFPSYKDFLSYNNINLSSISFSGLVHGLICLYKNCSSNPIGLCNPILKEIKILPESPHGSYGRHVGLGYDHVERDFKVVQISPHPLQEESAVVEVYSRKQNKWMQLMSHDLHRNIVISEAVQSLSSRGAFAHWHGRDRSPELITDGEFSTNLVVSFDMRSEAVETTRIPRFENAAAERYTVLAKEDSLIVFVWSEQYPSEDEEVIMWEYKLSGGGINKKRKRKRKRKREDWNNVGRVGPFGGSVLPRMWWKSGGLVLKLYSCKAKCVKIVLYDCCTQQIVRCIHHDLFLRLVQYNMPSFISPYDKLISLC